MLGRKGDTDVENGLVGAAGEGEGRDELRSGTDIYTPSFGLLYSRNQHNIVKQFSFN